MSIVKSFSVGNGDMFYIQHNSNNFTIIDCCLEDDFADNVITEIKAVDEKKRITRFISTHPDNDHIKGLKQLNDNVALPNFYCVENNATKKETFDDFEHYCALRDGDAHFYLYTNCKRKWMNKCDENVSDDPGSSGIFCLWPKIENELYQNELEKAANGESFNNISPIIEYSLEDGVTILWMGDMEHEFLEKIKGEVEWPRVDILFAPHHGRASGKVSADILKKLAPKVIVIGEAPSEYIDYHYDGYNTITQNTAKDITFDCVQGKVHVYFSNDAYPYDLSFLKDEKAKNDELGAYMGTFNTHEGACDE